jgi:hypothetical protein
MSEDLPSHFYKFTSATRAIEILITKQLWFSSPENFNDPFDCNIHLIDFEPNDEQIKMIINEKVAGNRKKRREEIKKNKQNAYRIRNQFAEQSDEITQKSGICCFSEKNDNILLWAHYGDSHKGVCLKFSSEISEIGTMTRMVEYKDSLKRASFFNEQGKSILHLFFTKAADWKYENENRIVRMLENGKTEFKIEYLTEIIFGCKTHKSVIAKVKKTISDLNIVHIKFRQAKQIKSSFKLMIE